MPRHSLQLTEEDWAEIFYALDLKRRLVEVGLIGRDGVMPGLIAAQRRFGEISLSSEEQDWADHLQLIMNRIGSDGKLAAQATMESSPPAVPNEDRESVRWLARKNR